MDCPSDQRVCRGKLELVVDGSRRSVFVKAIYDHGGILLALADESGVFTLGSQPFTTIDLTPSGQAHVFRDLRAPNAQLERDAPTPQLHLPVLRESKGVIAKLKIDVWAQQP